MWRFDTTVSDAALVHNRVPSTKWGVRKEMSQRARTYARAEYGAKQLGKRIEKINKKIIKRDEKGKGSERLARKKGELSTRVDTLKATMRKRAKSLSPKDLAQGRLAVTASRILRKTLKSVAISLGVSTLGVGGVALLSPHWHRSIRHWPFWY